MSWQDIIKTRRMKEIRDLVDKLVSVLEALRSGELDETIRFANNKENFKHESVKEGIGSLKLSKKEIEQTIKALLVGLEGQTMDEGERQMEVAGDRAHMASMERM